MFKFNFVILAVAFLSVIASTYAECKGDPNAYKSDCISDCPASCGSQASPWCPQTCDPVNGHCVCNDGYILNSQTQKCVTRDQCPGN